MHAKTAAGVLGMALLLPTLGTAQVYHQPTPAPAVTAETADWQVNGSPITVAGLLYYPTAGTRFFDGNVMVQVGAYGNVPIYADATLEPWSLVYVPVGRGLLRRYERRRDGDLAGTEGSRVPSFPVALTGEPQSAQAVGTIGTSVPSVERESTSLADTVPRTMHSRVESIARPSAPNGIWLEYEGARWFSDGQAVPFDARRFEQTGTYHGFPVYRDRAGLSKDIWIAVVIDGPVAPFAKR